MIEAIIIKTLNGEAPEWVRRAPLMMRIVGHMKASRDYSGLLSRKESVSDQDLFSILETLYLSLLESHHPAAAEWFYSRGFPNAGCNFLIKRDRLHILGETAEGWG